MSHRGRRQWNNDRRPPPPVESAEERLVKTIAGFGDGDSFNSTDELTILVQNLRGRDTAMHPAIAEAISQAVPLLPHKIPHYATLVALLYVPSTPSVDGEIPEPDPLGSQILHTSWKACSESMAAGRSRQLRAWVQFFSHLTVLHIVSPQNMLEFLQNIGKALDELGASANRLFMASSCIADGLLRAGSCLFAHDPESVSNLSVSVTSAFQELPSRELTTPIFTTEGVDTSELRVLEVSESLVQMLRSLEHKSYQLDNFFNTPQEDFPTLSDPVVQPFPLESFLLPPEQLEQAVSGLEDEATVTSSVELQQYLVFVYDSGTCPGHGTPEAHVLQSLVMDLVEIYESDRKSCAKHLVGLPRWFAPEIFPNKQSSDSPSSQRRGGWQLESSIMEVLISYLLMLPSSKIHPAYYTALVADMCKLSPSTFGPAVGKSFRKLHSAVGEGLDVEAVRRFADWFATHMSNFNFQWVWKEWSSDLELDPSHPKRVFLRRVIDLEIRMAYYDRITRSLPEGFQAPEAGVLPESAPGPDYTYSDHSHPHSSIAQDILSQLQGRTDPSAVISNIDAIRERLVDGGESEASAYSILRDIVVQSLMEIGARSFSHFLNAIERYIKLMRHITEDPEARTEIFEAAGKFWGKNTQMLYITVDKLLQYQFAEPTDLIKWTFKRHGGFIDLDSWLLIRSALDKAKGRLVLAEKKVAQLRKEHEDQVAAQKAQSTTNMDVEDAADTGPKAPQSAALSAVLEGYTALVTEHKRCLVSAFEGFANHLCATESVMLPAAWSQHRSWNHSQWNAFETWGWYKHYCRLYIAGGGVDQTELQHIAKQQFKTEHQESHRSFDSLWRMACGLTDGP